MLCQDEWSLHNMAIKQAPVVQSPQGAVCSCRTLLVRLRCKSWMLAKLTQSAPVLQSMASFPGKIMSALLKASQNAKPILLQELQKRLPVLKAPCLVWHMHL